jgi:hypothetical protein
MEQKINKNQRRGRNSSNRLQANPLSVAKSFADANFKEHAKEICYRYLDKKVCSLNDLKQVLSMFIQLKEFDAAIELINNATDYDDELIALRIETLLRLFKVNEALELAHKKVIETPTIEALTRLLKCLEVAENYNDMKLVYQTILAQTELDDGSKLKYAVILKRLGDYDVCVQVLLSVVEKNNLLSPRAYYELSNLKSYKFSKEQINQLELLTHKDTYRPKQLVYLYFSLGKAYEDDKKFGRAFHNFEKANKIKEKLEPYNPELTNLRVEAIKNILTKDFFSGLSNTGCQSSEPIFVVGMHRSGSTLVEQILASHSLIEGTKELICLPEVSGFINQEFGECRFQSQRHPRALKQLEESDFKELGQLYLEKTKFFREGKGYFVDKMPNNFWLIGLIKTILPNAKIIDVRRHPLGFGFAAYKQMFAKSLRFSNSLFDIGHYYNCYIDLMSHWKSVFPDQIYTIHYERLVKNSSAEIKALFSYLELPYEKQCESFYETERKVQTPSAFQVRQPIYDTSTDLWKNYEVYLCDLRDGLGNAVNNYKEV